MPNYKMFGLTIPDGLMREAEKAASIENIGCNELICKAVNTYVVQRRYSVNFEVMRRGYTEMSAINLTLAGDSTGDDSRYDDYCNYMNIKGDKN